MSITPTGYKIYWSDDLATLYTPHAHVNTNLSPAYDSPITVPGGGLTINFPVAPDKFWDDSYAKMYISISAYFDDGQGNITEGVKSKPTPISSANTVVRSGGYRMFSVPLDSGNAADVTISAVRTAIGSSRVQTVLRANSLGQVIANDNAHALLPHEGLVMVTTLNMTTTWRGTPWEKVA